MEGLLGLNVCNPQGMGTALRWCFMYLQKESNILLKIEKGDTRLIKPSIANFTCRTPVRQLPYFGNALILSYLKLPLELFCHALFILTSWGWDQPDRLQVCT